MVGWGGLDGWDGWSRGERGLVRVGDDDDGCGCGNAIFSLKNFVFDQIPFPATLISIVFSSTLANTTVTF